MIKVLPIPDELAPTSFSLSLVDNAGQEEMPFSGTVQRLAATFEKLGGSWTFKSPRLEQVRAVESFLLMTGSGRNLFSTSAKGLPGAGFAAAGQLDGAHTARSREITLKGLPVSREIPRGEWIQIGWQAARVMEGGFSSPTGTATVEIFPFLHEGQADGDAVKLGDVVNITWRMSGEVPALAYQASRHASLEVQLAASQEVISSRHELWGEEVPE